MKMIVQSVSIKRAGKIGFFMSLIVSLLLVPIFLFSVFMEFDFMDGLLLTILAGPVAGLIHGVVLAILFNIASHFAGGFKLTAYPEEDAS